MLLQLPVVRGHRPSSLSVQAQKEAENPAKYRSYKAPKVPKSEMTKNTPGDRLKIAREVAEEKAVKEGPNEKLEREKRKVPSPPNRKPRACCELVRACSM